jgi:hypothetical protein
LLWENLEVGFQNPKRSFGIQRVKPQPSSMKAISDSERILQMAVDGIPRVAQAIPTIPIGDSARALKAVERSYCQTALDAGYSETQAEGWAAALMFQMRAEMEKQKSSG